jgi:hypothetical protein
MNASVGDARDRARENVGANTNLTPAERETTLRLAADRDHAVVFTAERGVMSRLLAHPGAEIDHVRVSDGDVSGRVTDLTEYDGGRVVGVRASLPVGYVSITTQERQADGHAAIVSQRVLADDLGGGES